LSVLYIYPFKFYTANLGFTDLKKKKKKKKKKKM